MLEGVATISSGTCEITGIGKAKGGVLVVLSFRDLVFVSVSTLFEFAVYGLTVLRLVF